MSATITYASSRVTITGAYKSLTGNSTTTTITYVGGEAPASGDVGRFVLWCRGGTTVTGPWEIRRITAASATEITVHDPWTAAPSDGDTFRISSNADDILAAQPSSGSKTGTSSFTFSADLDLKSTAFFGSADESIEWTRTSSTTMFPVEPNCAIQCGVSWGGEGSALETTNGSRWSIRKTSSGDIQLYSSVNSRDESGFVFNMYGCLVETSSSGGYLFQRMRGPVRLIGCVFDGIMGGRFYHEASEWVACRMSGNNNAAPAWSIGATFTRDISDVRFYRNLMAMKSYLNFGGTLRDITFSNNSDIFDRGGANSADSIFNFIDSTEFPVEDTSGNNGFVNQYRSVSLVTTDAGGSALDGVAVRVNNKNDATQGAIYTSSGGGIVPEILALRFQQAHGSTTMTGYAPFRIRQRRYGYRFVSSNAAIADPIKQTAAQGVDLNVTQDSTTAAAHTGITLTDHGGSPVSWQSKSWGITVVGDRSVNSSLTASDIKHYLHYHLSQDAAIGGKASGLLWHNLAPMAGLETEADTYGSVTKGVRIVDENGDAFPGFTRFQSDDLSYYTVPITDDLTITSNQADTLIQIFETGTQTIINSATAAILVYTHSNETVDIVVQKAGYLPQRETGVVLSGDVTKSYTLQTDYSYDAAHGLTYTTDASWASNELTVPTFGPSVRQVYSLMIDSFIAQSSLRNTPFNLQMNGPTTLLLVNDAEGASDADIENMTAGGVSYINTSGTVTAEWCSVQSQGVVAGLQPEYVQSAGGTVLDARTTGNVNEVIKYFGDASHGSIDYHNYLEFKCQANGYRQGEASVLDTYGISSLEPTNYIINLTTVPIAGLTTGDPSVTGLSLTDNSSSPVSWDAGDGAKDYSVTITDTGSNSGEDILRWLNYNLSLDATFQGKDPWMWPEMVLDNGAAYETLRGTLHLPGGDESVGVRVIDGSGNPHPAFTRFQSDDGTYGTPPVVASLAITNIVAGSRLQIYNITEDVEMVNEIVAGTSYSDTYTDGTGYTAGDSVRVRLTYCDASTATVEFQSTVVASSSGWSVIADQQTCSVYESLAVDGTAVTGYAADYTDDEVDLTVATNFYISELFAWWKYNLTTELGIREFFGGITGLDNGNLLVNVATVSILLDNNTATDVWALDNRRFRRSDGLRPVRFPTTGGGGIDVEWRENVLLVETGVSGLTAEESAQLAKLTGINTESGLVLADLRSIRGIALTGSGVEGDSFRPV